MIDGRQIQRSPPSFADTNPFDRTAHLRIISFVAPKQLVTGVETSTTVTSADPHGTMRFYRIRAKLPLAP